MKINKDTKILGFNLIIGSLMILVLLQGYVFEGVILLNLFLLFNALMSRYGGW